MIVKRTLGYIFAIFALAFMVLPRLLLITLIFLKSRVSSILRQKCVGRYGKKFACYKFRSMKIGTKDIPTHQVPVD